MENDSLSNCFDAVIDPDERILWSGSPALVPYMLKDWLFASFYTLGAIFLSVKMFLGLIPSCCDRISTGLLIVAIPTALISTIPLWPVAGYFVLRAFKCRNTRYAYTNKGVLFRYGLLKTKYDFIDFHEITDTCNRVGWVEAMYGVGTIEVDTGRISPGEYCHKITDDMIAIRNSHEVQKHMASILVEIEAFGINDSDSDDDKGSAQPDLT